MGSMSRIFKMASEKAFTSNPNPATAMMMATSGNHNVKVTSSASPMAGGRRISQTTVHNPSQTSDSTINRKRILGV